MSAVNNIAKASLIGFWVFFVFSLTQMAPGTLYNTIVLIGALLIIAHVGEYLMVRNKLSALEYTGTGPLIQTLLFGFAYWLPLLKAKTPAQSEQS